MHTLVSSGESDEHNIEHSITFKDVRHNVLPDPSAACPAPCPSAPWTLPAMDKVVVAQETAMGISVIVRRPAAVASSRYPSLHTTHTHHSAGRTPFGS